MADAVQIRNRMQGLGWSPDIPSFKDWKFKESPWASLKPKGESADRRVGPITNAPVIQQEPISSCVGVATSYGVGWLARSQPDKAKNQDFSALQMYYDARTKAGSDWRQVDSGAYIRDAMDCLRDTGIAPEASWPYKPKKFAQTPSQTVYKAASRWKLGAHWRAESLEHIMVALDKGFAVVGGVTLYSSGVSEEVYQTGRVPMPSTNTRDTLVGGHALYFDRYTRADNLVRAQGSWGEEFGDGGYHYFPMEYIADRNLSDDFWIMENESPATRLGKN